MLLVYQRVSSADQVEGTSLDSQERIGRGFAMSKGFSQFETAFYVDPDVSASIPLGQRPSGRRLIDDAKPGDTVFASKLDRMFRSASDALYQVEFFQKHGIKVVLFDIGSEPICESAIGQFFFTCMAAVATLERATIKERCVNGRRAKIARGGHGGGEAPYGYKIVGRGRAAILEPVEDEQKIVERIRAEITEQPWISARALARQLEEEGVRSRNGGAFAHTQVLRIASRLQEQRAAS